MAGGNGTKIARLPSASKKSNMDINIGLMKAVSLFNCKLNPLMLMVTMYNTRFKIQEL